MPVNTKSAPHRTLRFASLAEVRAELDRIDAAHKAGTLRHTGNWTPGEIFDHLAIFFRMSLDGFPPDAKPPAIVKWLAKMFLKKKAAGGAAPPAGFKLPKAASMFLPRPDISYEDGMAELRRQLGRVLDGGEQMTKPSPLLGEMTHAEWTGLHRGHCALHLGFLDYPAA